MARAQKYISPANVINLLEIFRYLDAAMSKRSYKPCLFWLALSVLGLSEIGYAQVPDAAIQEVRHHVGGWSKQIQAYQIDLLNTILGLSEPEYGAYRLVIDYRKLTANRWNIGISKGDIHSSFKTDLISADEEALEVNYLSYPFAKSLLGLRRLIIRKEDIGVFAHIKDSSDLRALRVGQGRFWPDASVYKQAGIHVVPGESLDELFPMLKKKRFDFLPLSVLEVDEFFPSKGELNELTIADNLSIFYPIPVYMAVSKSAPDVEIRLAAGLRKLYDPANRKIADELFSRHFQLDMYLPRDNREVIIELDNGSVAKDVSDGILGYMNRNFCLFPKSCFVAN